tara:strand:+ start:159 stop:491 length:333 start_codon:yes stop_codon:yes gene_type:complete
MNENQILNAMIAEDAIVDLSLKYPWINRAVNTDIRTENNESVRTAVEKHPDLGWMVFPTIRLAEEGLKNYSLKDAMDIAIKNKDYVPVDSLEAGQALSHGLSNYLGTLDK